MLDLLKGESRIDINSNEGLPGSGRRRSRSRSAGSLSDDIPHNDKISVKRERALGSSEDEERDDGEIYDDDGLSIRRRNSSRQHSKEDDDDRGTASDGEDER